VARLLAASLLWAFSFGLIKVSFSAYDPNAIVWLRLVCTLPVFLPLLWLAPRSISLRGGLALAGIGAVQFGLMYVALFASYAYLQAYEVAAYTITTPLFVAIIAVALRERRWTWRLPVAVLLALAGALLLNLRGWVEDTNPVGRGFLFVQLANVTFALGQVLYRKAYDRHFWRADRDVFGWLYLGAVVVVTPFWVLGDADPVATVASITPSVWGAILYLGIVASGLGFFLWNSGARRVSTASLAVFNNLKIPLAIAVAGLVFGEAVPWGRVAVSGALIGLALWLAAERGSSSARDRD
jgi:drug/metabolite transporter (DMT)-like permease